MLTAQQQRVHHKPSDEENLEIWIDKTVCCESFKRTKTFYCESFKRTKNFQL